MIADRITDLIGNTPLLRIAPAIHGLQNIDLYAKLELMNPFGSLKDRIAWAMLKDEIDAAAAGGKTIIENSSGNTFKAIQAIAGTYGIKTRLVTNMARVKEAKDVIRLLGAEIEEVQGASDCFDPNDPNDPQFVIERAVAASDGQMIFPSQFTNEKNPAVHYETTGAEILADLGRVDYFFGGLGTSGSTLGTGRRLREANPDLACIGVSAAQGDFIPGIRNLEQLQDSGLFTRDAYDTILPVGSGAALDAMTQLIRHAGVLCGPSSGAIFSAALSHLRGLDDTLSARKTAVFIVCDRMEWYLSYIRERRPALLGERVKPGGLRAFLESGPVDGPVLPVAMAQRFIADRAPLIIDIRANQPFRMLSIPGSINIPAELFEPMIDNSHPFPADRPVLLVCQVGEKTRAYAAYLARRGCLAVSLEGGLLGWRTAQLPLAMSEAA